MFNIKYENCNLRLANVGVETPETGAFHFSSLLFTLIKNEFRCKYRYFFVTLHTKIKKSDAKASILGSRKVIIHSF